MTTTTEDLSNRSLYRMTLSHTVPSLLVKLMGLNTLDPNGSTRCTKGNRNNVCCASADMVQEQHNQDWPQSRRVLGDILVPADGDYSSTINTDTNDSDMFTTKDRRQTIEREGASGDEIKNLNLDLTRHTLALAAFAELRAKRIISGVDPPPSPDLHNQAEKLDRSSPPECNQKQGSNEATASRTTPQELYDRRTLRVPISWESPVTVHKYMASLDLLQKQVLVKSLAAQECLVELVERDSLNGADLIIDPHTAVIFTPLLSLPALHKKLLAMLSVQTWRYKHILVVFEAYPVSRSYRTVVTCTTETGTLGSRAGTVCIHAAHHEAIKRFRRDLDIAEGCGKKAAACDVWCAFADSVAEAATCARLFGDEAQRADCSGGALWGGREWLDDGVSEDEENLASLGGMNRFSALVVLCQMTLQEFLDLSAEQRTATIGPFIGPEATNMLNADIEQRMRTMESSGLNISQYEDMDIHESTELSR
ncbi:hypothetical protein FPV67DRAFT_392278 [Lyophyllum atratum]|nr:hypothetical protein FPV67DRAFT_392278 [Lyophyllum atratum]